MEMKVKLEIFLLLPEVADQRDHCVERLKNLLQARAGINDAHVVVPADNQPAQLCIHCDPERFSLADIRQLARQAGTEVTQRYGRLFVRTQSIWHTRQARRVSESLRGMCGVLEAEASADRLIRIEFDRDEIQEVGIRARLNELGVEVFKVGRPRADQREEPIEKEHEHGGLFDHRFELVFAILAGFFLLVGLFFEVSTLLPGWVPAVLYVVAYLFGGFFVLRETVQNLVAKRFEIDFLILFAAVGAAVLGKWTEGALLLFLFGLGHALEHFAMSRARHAIEALSELAPKTAIVKRDGNRREVSVEELQIGDVVVVQPNSRIPADAVVVHGTSSVDQSPVTGGSVPDHISSRWMTERRPSEPLPESIPRIACLPVRSTATALRKLPLPRWPKPDNQPCHQAKPLDEPRHGSVLDPCDYPRVTDWFSHSLACSPREASTEPTTIVKGFSHMLIAIGADHRGHAVRSKVIESVERLGHDIEDTGTGNNGPADYPDVALQVARRVSNKEADRGILIGGTGLGMSVAANKCPGVRAASCYDELSGDLLGEALTGRGVLPKTCSICYESIQRPGGP